MGTRLDLKNDGIGLNGLRHTANETMRAATTTTCHRPQYWISSSISSNQLGRRQESARDYLRKLQLENAEFQTAIIGNAQMQKAMQLQNAMNTENTMLLRRNLEFLQQRQQQQSFTNSAASASTFGMLRKPVLRRP